MRYLFVKNGKMYIKLQIDDIFYITTSTVPHLLHVVTRDGIYDISTQLQMLEKSLTLTFFRCHRKYLVNLSVIKGIDKSSRTITFLDEKVGDIYYSRRKQKELERLWKIL